MAGKRPEKKEAPPKPKKSKGKDVFFKQGQPGLEAEKK